jgi:hypothetical protein
MVLQWIYCADSFPERCELVSFDPITGKWTYRYVGTRTVELTAGDLLVVTPPSQAGAVGICANYQLTIQCGTDTVVVYPNSCSCNPTSLSFDPITLASCCAGTVTITARDECPPVDCTGLTCCCHAVPGNLSVTGVGFAAPDGALNGTFAVPLIAAPYGNGDCQWYFLFAGAGTPSYNLLYTKASGLWIAYAQVLGNALYTSATIPTADFDCLGPNTFNFGGGAFATFKPT